MRAQGVDLTKQVFLLHTAVGEFVTTIINEHANNGRLSGENVVKQVEVFQHSDQCAQPGDACENNAPVAHVDEAGLAVNEPLLVQQSKLGDCIEHCSDDTIEPASEVSVPPANDDPAASNIGELAHETITTGLVEHNTIANTNKCTANEGLHPVDVILIKSPSINTKRNHSRQSKRCRKERNHRSRGRSREVDIGRDHGNYADRLICRVARMTRVDVPGLSSPHSHHALPDNHSSREIEEQSRHRFRRHCESRSSDQNVNNSSPVTTSSGYGSDLDCIREEEIDKLLHGEGSPSACREKRGEVHKDRREAFVIRPDDKYEDNHAMNSRTRCHDGECHRNARDFSVTREYHDQSRKLTRVARSMEQIIRDLQSPERPTKCTGRLTPPNRIRMTPLPVSDDVRCGRDDKLAQCAQQTMTRSGQTSGVRDTLLQSARSPPVIHHGDGISAFRPYAPCKNTAASTRNTSFPCEGQIGDGQQVTVNPTDRVHILPESTNQPLDQSMSKLRIVCSPTTLRIPENASPDSGRGSWSTYDTSPDANDRKCETVTGNWLAPSSVDAFHDDEHIYETIDDAAMLSRGTQSPTPLPQRHLTSRTVNNYDDVSECTLSRWKRRLTPPHLPPRVYLHNSFGNDTYTQSRTNNHEDNHCRNETAPTPTASTSDPRGGAELRRREPEVRHMDDIVKNSDIVDLSAAHVYTVADVLESIHGYVGHLSPDDAHDDKPSDVNVRTVEAHNHGVAPETDYHLLTKAVESPTPQSSNINAPVESYHRGTSSLGEHEDGSRVPPELGKCQDDAADSYHARGHASSRLETWHTRTDLMRSSLQSLQGTYC